MKPGRKRPILRGIFFGEVVGKNGNVFAPFAQRRQREGDYIEAIVEVGAELASFDHCAERNVGCGDDANVDMQRAAFSEAIKFALLQNAEKFWLEIQRHFSDFVEENRSAVG